MLETLTNDGKDYGNNVKVDIKNHNTNSSLYSKKLVIAKVIVQGALMCGYHAANAVFNELEGRNGFEEYTKCVESTP